MFTQKLKKKRKNDTNHVMYVFLPVFLPKRVMKKDEKKTSKTHHVPQPLLP